MEAHLIAPCGVNCAACGAHLDRKKPCPGCRAPSDQIKRKSCVHCAKKNCAFEQGFSWCFECPRFPCSRIKSLDKTYRAQYDVDLIQNGIDARADMNAFLQAQSIRFACLDCGEMIDQHRRRCSACGKEA